MTEQRDKIESYLDEIRLGLFCIFLIIVAIFFAILLGCSKPENPPLPKSSCWECQFNGSGPPPPNNIYDSCGTSDQVQSWVITMERKEYQCKEKLK